MTSATTSWVSSRGKTGVVAANAVVTDAGVVMVGMTVVGFTSVRSSGHVSKLHSFFCAPGQPVPPCFGVILTLGVRHCIPPLHGEEHTPHWSHIKMQFTGQKWTKQCWVFGSWEQLGPFFRFLCEPTSQVALHGPQQSVGMPSAAEVPTAVGNGGVFDSMPISLVSRKTMT